MWEFVDKVVYINLDHREDRRQVMQKFFVLKNHVKHVVLIQNVKYII